MPSVLRFTSTTFSDTAGSSGLRRFLRACCVLLVAVAMIGCAARKPKAKSRPADDDLPMVDANKVKKIEVIHVPAVDLSTLDDIGDSAGSEESTREAIASLLNDEDDDEEQDAKPTAGSDDENDKEASKKEEATAATAVKSSEKETKDESAEEAPKKVATTKTPAKRAARGATKSDGDEPAASAEKPTGPLVMVTMPGFRAFRDGSSRVYVRISGRAKVVEKKDEGKLRYHLTGVTVPERVNRMALPTGHFKTPVSKAFVAQVEGGADLVIMLREPAKGSVRLRKRGGGIMLSIDFAKQRKIAEEEKDPLADAG